MPSERAIIMRHAGTVMVGQLAVMGFSVTDTLVASRFADTALAGLAVASATYVTVHISLMGMLQALLPVWAELHGAQRFSEVGRSVRQALYLWAVISILGMSALLQPDLLLQWTNIPQDLQEDVRQYLNIVAWGVPASLLFRMYSTLNQSLGKPKLVTWIQVVALIVKVPLSIVLVLGISGWIPALGLAGCAWATLLVTLFMVSLGFWLIRTQAFYKPYRLWYALEKPDVFHVDVFVHRALRGCSDGQSPNRVQLNGCVLHGAVVVVDCQQFTRELLAGRSTTPQSATGPANRLDLGLGDEFEHGCHLGLAT